MSRTEEGFGGGKVILLGEHAVVHGVPAIAAGVRRGVRATAQPAPEDVLHVEPWGRTWRPTQVGDEQLSRAFDHVLAFYDDRPPLRIDVQVELPRGAGLGCSAALGVSVLDAIDKALGVDRSRIALGTRALAWEKFFHGAPSGIDNAVAALGGLLRFQRPSMVSRITPLRTLHLVVGHSGERSSTKDMVAWVARQLRERPVSVNRKLDEVRELVDEAEAALQFGEVLALGQALDRNHRILRDLHLSTPRLEALCRAAKSAGALGAKVTGAGGGGCMVALAEDPDHAIRIADALDADSFIEEVGRAA